MYDGIEIMRVYNTGAYTRPGKNDAHVRVPFAFTQLRANRR
jgi:hypothetical protein